MTKLKTLKDICPVTCPNPSKAYDDSLQAEAIKWIKYFCGCRKHYTAKKFMKFFNITDEELE